VGQRFTLLERDAADFPASAALGVLLGHDSGVAHGL
jgi:hypothetical protein